MASEDLYREFHDEVGRLEWGAVLDLLFVILATVALIVVSVAYWRTW